MDTAEDGTLHVPIFSAAAGAPRRCDGRKGAPVRLAALVALLLAFAPAALSAGGDAAPAPPAAREQIPQGAALPLLGRDVIGPAGQVVAQIVNVLVDGSGRPLAAILDYGGFMGVGRRRIAVTWGALRFAPGGAQDGTITLGLTRDQLKDFPDAKKGEPIIAAAPAAAAPN